MPCYDPPPTPEEQAEWRREYRVRGDWKAWYESTPQKDIEQWLCDALRGNPPHQDCITWWELHKQFHDKKR